MRLRSLGGLQQRGQQRRQTGRGHRDVVEHILQSDDLIRIRTAGVGGVVNDLTQATQAARALSRDVDHLIEAASEVKEAMG